MTTRDFAIALFFTLISGGLTLFFHQIYLNKKEKKKELKQKVITFPNEKKLIDESIFTALSPGNSIELMRSVLGTSNKIYLSESPLFEDYIDEFSSYKFITSSEKSENQKWVPTNAYLYRFENALVKITSRDKQEIDSLTVLTEDNNISFDGLILPYYDDELDKRKLKFGEYKVSEGMANSTKANLIRGTRDNSFALSFYTGMPLDLHFTYFGMPKDFNTAKYTSESFVGDIIDGVCISRDISDVHYIWFYELI